MLRIENISEENFEDVFKVCSGVSMPSDPILEKGRELKRQWLLDMLKRYGSCTKIAYLDEKPVAQMLFYPEETLSYLRNPRKDVIYLKCIFNAFPEAQGKGVGATMLKTLIDECHTGVDCLGGGSCRFMVTQPFPHEGGLSLGDFFSKYGFKQGNQELFLEIKGKYVPREIREYRPLPEDRGKVIISYNIDCEWGLFFATKVRELIQGRYPNLPFDTINNWERPEEYKKRPYLSLIFGSVIVNAHEIKNPFLFWADQAAFLGCVEEALRK